MKHKNEVADPLRSMWDNPWFLIPTLLAIALSLVAAYYLPYGDEILAFNGLRREPLNSIFYFITYLGEFYAFIIAGVVLFLLRRHRYVRIIALTGVLMIPLSYVLKDTIGTMRPLTWFTEGGRWQEVVTVPGVELRSGNTSFPSGHTMSAFALCSILALMLDRRYQHWGLAFALLAILVGVSRIFLVQHFLADVLSGATLGLLIGWAVWDIMNFKRNSGMGDKVDD